MNTHLNCPGCGRLVDIPGLCKECFDDGVNKKFWDEKKKRFYTDKEIIKQRDETIKQLKEALREMYKSIEYGELELRTTYKRFTYYKGSSSLWTMQEMLVKYEEYKPKLLTK